MASKEITFDPTAGVPVASSLTIYGGADFAAKYTVTGSGNLVHTSLFCSD